MVRLTLGPILQTLRLSTILSLPLNAATSALGWILVGPILRHHMSDACAHQLVPVAGCAVAAAAKVSCTVATGVAQGVVASTISRLSIGERFDPDLDFHLVAQTRYRRWLWWTRLGLIITIMQFAMAIYLVLVVANDLTSDSSYNACFKGKDSEGKVIALVVLTWLAVLVQCITGSDVLRWRSFYASHDTAWRAHYREVFDHGIREALCCLGRVKYLSVMEDDEVYTVARLLGDLMAYRASGTGHFELLAGLALLQKHKANPVKYDAQIEAPITRLKEAAFLHKFAEAAYTGLLLDLGRHPLSFPCVWIYRQGTFTPWTRNKRPNLEGDNWWRGHAAAFLNYVNLPSNSLLKGRVSQSKREAAYFVTVLREIKTIVVAIRGTETPEDLITDGLCGECSLNTEDLDGLINSDELGPLARQKVMESFPHYGHSGIVESARELYKQINGCLSSLLGEGCEYQGYEIRIVGHSLGGSVATVLAIMLYGRYPNLHVYSYGPLPCLDPVLADSCSSFVTSIVYNDEFSARLSVNSIIRLRASAVRALSNDSSANSALISNFVKKIINISKKSDPNPQITMTPINTITTITQNPNTNNTNNNSTNNNQINNNNNNIINNKNISYTLKGGAFLCGHAMACMMHSDSNLHRNSKFETISPNNLHEHIIAHYSSNDDNNNNNNNGDGGSIMGTCGAHASEVYLPGMIVHIVRGEKRNLENSILNLKSWISDKNLEYKAFVVNKERFMDIVVSPYMFLDHLPWRCNYALQKALECRNEEKQEDSDLLTEDSLV